MKASRSFTHEIEARFLAEAQLRGLLVSKPAGDSLGYNLLIDTRHRLFRVRTKGAHLSGGLDPSHHTLQYQLNFRPAKSMPRPRVPNFDVAACWLVEDAVWTFFPRARCVPHLLLWKSSQLHPTRADWRPAINDWAIFERG